VHHRLNSGSDRLKPSQPQQVQRRGAQRGHGSGAIAAIAVGVLMELGVEDPVPAFNAPAVANQFQQRFWRGAQAGEKQMGGVKGLAIAAACGHDFHDPAGAGPGLPDVLRRLFGPQRPGDVAPVADLVIRCRERDLGLSLKLAADLAVQRLLVGLDRQQEVGPLLLELPKNIPSPHVAPFGSVTPTADLLQNPQNLDREMTFRCRNLFGGLPPSKNMARSLLRPIAW
jgi:hypothetical protein